MTRRTFDKLIATIPARQGAGSLRSRFGDVRFLQATKNLGRP